MAKQEFTEILKYWFGSDEDDDELFNSRFKLWFGKSDAVDREIRQRFGKDVERAAAGRLEHWLESSQGRLASIILIDQFCRQIHRGTSRAFENDLLALGWCLEGIELGHDRQLSRPHRVFFYLPLEHSEDMAHQDLSVSKYRELIDEAPDDIKPIYKGAFDFAQRHREIILRFGRYPHRNQILGRKSTTEEIEFLTQPGSSF